MRRRGSRQLVGSSIRLKPVAKWYRQSNRSSTDIPRRRARGGVGELHGQRGSGSPQYLYFLSGDPPPRLRAPHRELHPAPYCLHQSTSRTASFPAAGSHRAKVRRCVDTPPLPEPAPRSWTPPESDPCRCGRGHYAAHGQCGDKPASRRRPVQQRSGAQRRSRRPGKVREINGRARATTWQVDAERTRRQEPQGAP